MALAPGHAAAVTWTLAITGTDHDSDDRQEKDNVLGSMVSPRQSVRTDRADSAHKLTSISATPAAISSKVTSKTIHGPSTLSSEHNSYSYSKLQQRLQSNAHETQSYQSISAVSLTQLEDGNTPEDNLLFSAFLLFIQSSDFQVD